MKTIEEGRREEGRISRKKKCFGKRTSRLIAAGGGTEPGGRVGWGPGIGGRQVVFVREAAGFMRSVRGAMEVKMKSRLCRGRIDFCLLRDFKHRSSEFTRL